MFRNHKANDPLNNRRVLLALPVLVVDRHRSSARSGRPWMRGRSANCCQGRLSKYKVGVDHFPIENRNQAFGRKGLAGRALAEPVAPRRLLRHGVCLLLCSRPATSGEHLGLPCRRG